MVQTLFFIGLFMLAMAVQFSSFWSLMLGCLSLLLACLTPIARFLFTDFR
ncbi:hypothetical protein [Azonexus sp.]|jgi:hypothetical protein|nr:hypothetical protein [Azonexus sp.]MDR1995153.1 hypothetical protein [Azonexus sp.]